MRIKIKKKSIFEMYKFKCKLKRKHIQLPEFFKEVKVSFHFNQINMLLQLPAQSIPTYTDIINAYQRTGYDTKALPTIIKSVGEETCFMICIKYLW